MLNSRIAYEINVLSWMIDEKALLYKAVRKMRMEKKKWAITI